MTSQPAQPAQPALATCPRCGAGVRPGTDWCTLCFADLRPVPPPRVSPDPMVIPPPLPVALVAALDPTVQEPSAVPVATIPGAATSAPGKDAQLPCPTCGSPVLLSVAVCQSCGAGLFDQLKSEAASLKLPVVGDVMKMSKGARTGAAFGVAVVVTTILIVLIELLGKL